MAFSTVKFLRAYHFRIDRGGRKPGMTEPALQEGNRDAGLYVTGAEAVPANARGKARPFGYDRSTCNCGHASPGH